MFEGEAKHAKAKKKGHVDHEIKKKAHTKTKKAAKKIDPAPLRGSREGKGNATPAQDLRRLFREMDLPEKFAPKNVLEFHYDKSSGNITIVLASAFEKRFDSENVIHFDRVIHANLKPGRMTRIEGITRGSARIISVERSKPGKVAITGKLGWFKKTLEFSDSQLPDLP